MTVQRENFDVAVTEVVQEAESVLEATPVVEPQPPAEVPKPKKEEDPEVTPMCCGGHPIPPLYGSGQVLFMHETTCPNYQG